MSPQTSPSTASQPHAGLTRFGRFELRGLLGRSTRTMVWRAFDPVAQREVVLNLPRTQPDSPAAVEAWLREVRHAGKLSHPHLAPMLEIGAHEQWPFAICDRALGQTLRERLAEGGELGVVEAGRWASQIIDALAFAHEAGVAHRDLQLQTVLIDERGHLRVMGLGVAGDAGSSAGERASALDGRFLEVQRAAARRDLVAVGVLLHRLLTHRPALDEDDVGRIIDRVEPPAREVLRLPWSTPEPVPQALRAIVNRSTDSVPKQRYQNARTFLQALDAWKAAHVEDTTGPIELLMERLQTVGFLPALPGVAQCVAHLALMESQRTEQIAQEVLGDLALTFEMLRRVNSAQVRSSLSMGSGPVLTIRRCIAMLGMDGIRFAAQGLRSWPGPLTEAPAAALGKLIEKIRLAGFAGQALRPAGYDPEVVFLITALQSVGRLALQYHFAEEYELVKRLMLPTRGTPATAGLEVKGLSEDAACMEVLGVDMDAICSAVYKHWGLPDEVVHMARKLSTERPVRACETDADLLRATSSAAIELVDAHMLAPSRMLLAMALIAQRYGKVLSVSPRDLASAMESAKRATRTTPAMPVPKSDAAEGAESHLAQDAAPPIP